MALPEADGPDEARRHNLKVLSRATRAELEQAWQDLDNKPDVRIVRGPETGLLMVKGRIGGGGAPFNLGEVTVSRATVRLDDGTIGHGHTLGTDRVLARLAAIFDALAQSQTPQAQAVIGKIVARIEAADANEAAEVAATRVDFFTMVRGDE